MAFPKVEANTYTCGLFCSLYVQVLLAGIAVPANAQSIESRADCEDIPGTETTVARESTILVGEGTHGTKEMPAVFVRQVCSALRRGRSVVVGLELSDERTGLQPYMASVGDATARSRLLANPFWREFHDGRSSEAWFKMIETFRLLRERGFPVAVFGLLAGGRLGDATMAESLRREVAARPDTLIFTLTGSVHSMMRRGRSLMPGLPDPMGTLIAELPRAAIEITNDGGQAWNCVLPLDCGVRDEPPDLSAPGSPPRVALPHWDRDTFNLRIQVGPTTASPPAIGTPAKSMQDRSRNLGLLLPHPKIRLES